MPKLQHLKNYHKSAIKMRYEGLRYQTIAEMLNKEFLQCRVRFTEQTIKDFFKKKGVLRDPYIKYESEWDAINKELFLVAKKAGIQILEKNFRTACEVLSELLNSNADNVRISATKELLNRILGKVKLPIEIKIDINDMHTEKDGKTRNLWQKNSKN